MRLKATIYDAIFNFILVCIFGRAIDVTLLAKFF